MKTLNERIDELVKDFIEKHTYEVSGLILVETQGFDDGGIMEWINGSFRSLIKQVLKDVEIEEEARYETPLAKTIPWNYARTKYFTAGRSQAVADQKQKHQELLKEEG